MKNLYIHSYQKIKYCNGSYYALLPWRTDHTSLTSNLKLRKQHLVQIMSWLTKLDLIEVYKNTMAEHLLNGYIEEVPIFTTTIA